MSSKRNIDYSVQLPDIGVPTDGGAGTLFAQAAAKSGEAEAMKMSANTNLLANIGGMAIQAGKGYLEAGVEREIKDTIDQTPVGEKAQAAAQDYRNFMNEQVAVQNVMGEMGAVYRPEVMAMSSEGQRVMAAAEQGLLSRDEALARISTTVKKYSAMMPGWASDFRKIAAELTGVDKVDRLAVHNFFTKEDARAKAAERRAEVQLQLDKELASYFGIGLDQISQQHRQAYMQLKGVRAAHDELDAKIKSGNLVQGEADKAFGQMVMLDTASQIASLNADLVKLGALNADPTKFRESQEFGLQLSTKIGLMFNAVSQRVREMVKPDPNRPSMSVEQAQRTIDSLKKDFDSYQDMVKSVEGRNMFLNLVKKSEGDVTMMMNNFSLASPHTALLGKYGVFPPIFQAYMSMMDKKEFETRFPGLAGPVEALLNPPSQQMYAKLFGTVMDGQPVNLREVARVSPEMAKLCAADLLECAKAWPKDANATPEKRTAWSRAMGVLGNTLNFSVDKDIDAAVKAVAAPEFKTFARSLSSVERNVAFAPLLVSIDTATRNNIGEVQAGLDAWNSDENNKARNAGWRLTVQQDPITKELKVVPVNSSTGPRPGPTGPMGTWNTGRTGGVSMPAGVGQNSQETQRRVQTILNRINKSADVFYEVGSLLGVSDMGSSAAFRDHVFSMVRDNKRGPLSAGFDRALEQTSNAPRNRAVEPLVDALGMAESNGDDKAVGDGGRARGRFQMHPEAMIDVGFKPEDRDDPVKSRQAAVAYFGKQLEAHGGDVFKAIAAWNMGPTGFANHLKRHGDMWMMELPAATQGLIRRFQQHNQPR